MDGLPSCRVHAKSSASKAGEEADSRKQCLFPCGPCIFGVTPDPVNQDETIRWAYANGRGVADHYCERSFLRTLSHRYETREEAAAAAMGLHSELQEKFLVERKKVIERATKKLERTSGGTHANIVKEEDEELQFLPPPDTYLPWNQYKSVFPYGLQKGHKLVTRGRHRGVLMPGKYERGTPWQVQRKFGFGFKKSKQVA